MTEALPLVLASASPARLGLLRATGDGTDERPGVRDAEEGVHHRVAECVLQPLYGDEDIVCLAGHQSQPNQVKNTAKNASRTITRKMP